MNPMRHKCGNGGLLMMRTRGLAGPKFQSSPAGCIKGPGNFYAPGHPGSGPQAIRGEVDVSVQETVRIYFTQCVDLAACIDPYGCVVEVEGVEATIIGVFQDSDTVLRFVIQSPVQAGDTVRWWYTEGGPACLIDCEEGEGIGDQGPIAVVNDVVLAGDYVLLEIGGTSIVLLEDDATETDGVQLEDAT